MFRYSSLNLWMSGIVDPRTVIHFFLFVHTIDYTQYITQTVQIQTQHALGRDRRDNKLIFCLLLHSHDIVLYVLKQQMLLWFMLFSNPECSCMFILIPITYGNSWTAGKFVEWRCLMAFLSARGVRNCVWCIGSDVSILHGMDEDMLAEWRMNDGTLPKGPGCNITTMLDWQWEDQHNKEQQHQDILVSDNQSVKSPVPVVSRWLWLESMTF